MGQDLKSRITDIAHTRHTELSADLVFASRVLIASQDRFGEVTPLPGEVQDEGGSICI